MSEIQVRELSGDDVETIMPLMIQLGYELNIDDLRARFDSISGARGHAILGAEKDGQLAGFCHVYARPALEKPPEAIVQSLVVDTGERKSGIGRALMQAVEDFARRQGFASVALYSQMERKDAHAFYGSLGYELIATSGLLRKALEAPPS